MHQATKVYCTAQGTTVSILWSEVKVTQSCLTLCDPMDYTVHGILQARILGWVEPFPSPGNLPNSGIEPPLQEDSLPAEPPRNPKNTGGVAYPFSSESSRPRNWTRVSCIVGRFFTSWATREAINCKVHAKLLQLCPTLCHPLDYSLPGSSVHSPGKNTGVGCHALLQGIFPTRDQIWVSSVSCFGRRVLYHCCCCC